MSENRSGEESHPAVLIDGLLDKADAFSKVSDRARALGIVTRVCAVDEAE